MTEHGDGRVKNTLMNGITNHRMLYTVLGLGFAMLVLGGCAQASSASNTTQNGQQSTTPTGTQSVVTTGTVQTTIVATGKVVARDLADIAFQRSGQIISVTVQEGQTVKKGQPLAYLDQSGLSLALQNQ